MAQIATIPEPYFAYGCKVEHKETSAGALDYFDRSPEGVVCPHFWKLNHGTGCLGNCDFCYLKFTLWKRELLDGGTPLLLGDHSGTVKAIQRWFQIMTTPSILNCGETIDSLAFDDYTHLSEHLFPLFESSLNIHDHCALYVSRMCNVTHLIDMAPELFKRSRGHIILSWSLNPQMIVSAYEHDTSTLAGRLDAAARAQAAGYRVRLRIDPIIPTEGWGDWYMELVHQVKLAGLTPERWTLGALRLLPGMQANYTRGRRHLDSLDLTGTDVRIHSKVPTALRMMTYASIRDWINCYFPRAVIGLCKEPEVVRKAVGVQGTLCNCSY